MAGKFSNTHSPGRGYTETVTCPPGAASEVASASADVGAAGDEASSSRMQRE